MNQEDIRNLNTSTTSNNIESDIEVLKVKKRPELDGFVNEFYQILKEKLTMFLKLIHKVEKKGVFSNSVYEPN